MDGDLTLLTERYPFFPGEEFVHQELAYLARGFRRVHVLPTAPVRGAARAMPSNALLREDCMAFLRRARRRPRAWRAAMSLADRDGQRLWQLACTDPALRRGLPGMAGWLPTRLRRTAEFIGHALMVRDALRAHPTGRLTYSFWLQAGVVGADLAGHAPLAARAHGHDLYEARHSDQYLPLTHHAQQRLDRLFFVSEHGLRYASRRSVELSAGRFRLARLGVPPACAPARASDDGVFRIFSCARALPVKRIDLLVDALHCVNIPIEWAHAGGGPELHRLQARAARLPACVRAQWLGDLPHAAVLERYASQPMDLFVNTSASEGLPVSIMEAMSFGVPVLAPDVGGIAELVSDATGRLLPAPLQLADLTQALCSMAHATSAQRTFWRTQAHSVWAERANAERQYPLFVNALRELGRLPEFPVLSPKPPPMTTL